MICYFFQTKPLPLLEACYYRIMKITNILQIMSCLVLLSQQAYAINRYKIFDEGRWDLDAQMNYMRSDANYKLSGEQQSLINNNYYQLFDTALGTRYSWSDSWALYGYLNIGNAESKGIDSTRTNSSLSKAWVGTEFLISLGNFELIPEVSLLVPLEKVNSTQDSVMNNEGVNEFTAKMNAQMEMRSFLMFGYIGFTYRDQGRSYLMPWGVNAEFKMSKFSLGGELFGFQSITSDADKGNLSEANREFLSAKVNGGSKKFYSIDPSVIDFNIYFKLNINPKMELGAGAGTTISGANYAAGFHAGAFFTYSFGGASTYYERSRTTYEESKISTDRKTEKFQEDTQDGVDQQIFRPQPTPVPKPPPPPPKKKRYSPSQKDLQNKMDDVEMSIELKSKKKKRR